MLNLLSTMDAALILDCIAKKESWKLAFNPQHKMMVLDEEKGLAEVLMYQKFIENAIVADELPAKKIPFGRVEDKKVFEKFDVPVELQNRLSQYNYWITLEDFFTFMERPSVISKDYVHGREALVRLLCALIDSDKLNEKELNEYLAHKIETAEARILNANLKLAENTLKGCCKEILETFSTIKTNNLKK